MMMMLTLQESFPILDHLGNKGKLMIRYAPRVTTMLPKKMISFSTPPPPDAKPDMFDVDDGNAEYVSGYLYSTISDDSFKAIMESTKNPNINFFEPPLLNSLVANSLKLSEN